MGHYLKIFAAAFLCFSAVIFTGFYIYVESEPSGGPDSLPAASQPTKSADADAADMTDLQAAVAVSDRVNVLMMGSDGGRSDTMMLMSFDPKLKQVDLISVPRDTYNPLPGHTGAGTQKLNAVYGFKGDAGGPEGVRKQVETLLNVPVAYYVNIDYDGVREVVDILGGIPVEVNSPMIYDDEYDDPPLHIRFEPGSHLLTGNDAVKYLRWRKNNGEEGAGDLGRIERQHDFVRTAVEKAVGLKLPQVIQASFRHIKTDMPVDRMLRYGVAMAGFDPKEMHSYRIPGEVKTIDGLSCYVHDPVGTEALLLKVYTGKEPEVPEETVPAADPTQT